MTETKLSDTGQHILLQNALIVLRFHCTLHTFKTPCARCSKAALEHNRASSMFHSRYSVLFFVCFIFCICEHRADVTCQKAPVFSHLSKGHSPRSFNHYSISQYAFWQIPVSLFYDLLSTVESSSFDFGSNSDGWCDPPLMYLDLGVHL